MLFIVNFNIAQTRIIEVLHINEIVSIAAIPSSIHHPVEMVEMGQHLEGTPFLNFENYYGFWSSVAQSTDRPVLRNISLNFCPEFASSRLTSVIGRIGSGKTSLLLSILKEIPYSRGVMNVNGTIAYVEQEPYVFEGSIRDNILFG
jgi:ABC-type multidrug transport system fused ATPase/permease subunit